MIQFLLQHYPEKYTYRIDGRSPRESIELFKAMSPGERMNFRLVFGHGAHELVDLVHPDTFLTTILREPVERIASHYYYAKTNRSHYLHSRIIEESIPLEQYTRLGLSNELSNWYVAHFSGLSQDRLSEEPQQALKLAIKTVTERYALIGFQDDMAGFLEALAESCNLETPESDLRENVTLNKKELTQAEYASIAESNALDIQLYEKVRALR